MFICAVQEIVDKRRGRGSLNVEGRVEEYCRHLFRGHGSERSRVERKHLEVREYVVNVIGMRESDGPMSPGPNNATIKEPSRETEILDVATGSERGIEVDEERSVSDEENKVVNVGGSDVKEAGLGYSTDDRVYGGLRQAEGDEPTAKEGAPSIRSFADAEEGL